MAVQLDGGSGLAVVVDADGWRQLKADLDRFDPALTTALRRRIKDAGTKATQKIREELGKPLPTDGRYSAGRRQGIAAATRITVSFAKRQAGARIVASASALDKEHKGLLKVYNTKHFRHPVYPRASRDRADWKWAGQEGRPYFGSVILKVMDESGAQDVYDAIDDAVKAVGAQGAP